MYLARSIFLALLLSGTSAFGLVLDWSTVTWTSGSLSQAYDVDADNTEDVLVTIVGNTSALTGGSPSITTGFQGTSLGFFADFSAEGESITVYVTFLEFHGGEISFSLYDIDGDRKGLSTQFGYQDRVSQIEDIDGNSIPDVTVGSGITYANDTAVGRDTVPNSSSDGNVDVYFNDALKTFEFTFTAGQSTGKDPDPQEFGFSNIQFKKPVVPEVGASRIAVLICLMTGMAGPRLRRYWANR